MATKNTLTDTLNRLAKNQKNLEEALDKLSKMYSSEQESLEVEVEQQDGSIKTYQIPTISHLNGKVDDVNNMLTSLIKANENEIGIELNNGSVKKFSMQNISEIVSDLNQIQSQSLSIPEDFKVKNNWFFEEFLNPLLYVEIDVSNYMTDQIDQFDVKRIIVNPEDQTQQQYFENNIKNRNDIDLQSLIVDLETQGIPYDEDDDITDLPVSINGKKGEFSVLKIIEEQVQNNSGERVVYQKYKLDSVYYTDVTSDNTSSTILSEGDILVTQNGAEYKVDSVNASERMVTLVQQFGIEGIKVGSNTLKIKPEPVKIPELQVNIGYDERQVIFIKPINRKLDLTTDVWSAGFGFYSNELEINLPDGTGTTTLENYYNNFVSDFGLMFLNFAKEAQIPASLGELPDPPSLSPTNFKVVKTKEHIKQSEALQNLNQKIADKEKLQNQINEINNTINDLKDSLNNSNNNQNERLKIRKSIRESNEEKKNLYSQLVTLTSEITNEIRTNPQFNVENKHQVTGFWDIPTPKSNEYGNQEVVQFEVQYRYLNKNGNAGDINQQQFIDSNGAEKQGTISQWNSFFTKVRDKVYNEETGTYQWSDENVRDPEVVNVNQLSIPIEKGENVEIRIRSLSEAGFPTNPIKSEFSAPVVVEFPEQLESEEEDQVISQQQFAEQTRIQFENELSERGLDTHLLNSFTSGDRYYAHRTSDIATQFFNQDDQILDLSQKLQEMQNRIDALEAAVSQTKGVLKVNIIDESGNVTEVNNNTEVNLFAGYYKDQVTDSSGSTTNVNHGDIVNKTYIVSLENTAQTPLALVSRVAGGIGERVPNFDDNTLGDANEDYKANRQYHNVPISVVGQDAGNINGFKHRPPFQSSQVRSQFIYGRKKSYDLNSNLHVGPITHTKQNYDFEGIQKGNDTIPYGHNNYVPFDPTVDIYSNNNTDSNVWNGKITNNSPEGDGYITEFCIHKDHPELTDFGDYASGNNFYPRFPRDSNGDYTGEQPYPRFAHAPYMNLAVNETLDLASGTQQVEYNLPADPQSNLGGNGLEYPIKLGFRDNDKYLIGKFTCGAYLFMAPQDYRSISIEGNHPDLSRRELDFGGENSINIPVVFQYRASDILGHIGGYRKDESLDNITYEKKIGIDIYIKESVTNKDGNQADNIFSFDIAARCKYGRDFSASNPVNIPNTGQFDQIVFNDSFN
jgi:hypothetical protein